MTVSHPSMLQTILFYLISFAAVMSALGVVTARSAVYGVLCLVSSMCMIAGLFVLLQAYLAATVLVLVYAGAILVLFLFVVMLIDFRKPSGDWRPGSLSTTASAALALLLFGFFRHVAHRTSLPETSPVEGNIQAVGTLLFNRE